MYKLKLVYKSYNTPEGLFGVPLLLFWILLPHSYYSITVEILYGYVSISSSPFGSFFHSENTTCFMPLFCRLG